MARFIGVTDGGGGDSAAASAGASSGAFAGSISLGTVVIRDVGISPSIGTAPGETWLRGNQWPPANSEPPSFSPPPHWHQNPVRHFTPVTFPNGPGNPFEVTMPPRAWDPAFYQIVLLTEFARNWAPNAAMTDELPDDSGQWDCRRTSRKREPRSTDRVPRRRPGRGNVANEQLRCIFQRRIRLFGVKSSVHQPSGAGCDAGRGILSDVLQESLPTPAAVSTLAAAHATGKAVPGHASFPSAHSTQANTIALVLQAVAAAAVPSAIDITTRLAQRIARGRELLGLHYPSDSEAGLVLAQKVATTYLGGDTVSRLVTAAEQEWAAFMI